MSINLGTRNFTKIIILVSSLSWAVPRCDAQQTKKPFTVADEIRLAHFGDPYLWHADTVHFSPDGNYLAVNTERGRLDLNRPEDSLRFYRTRDLENFTESLPPSPIWVVSRSDGNQEPIIKYWRWLADSSGVAFLAPSPGGNQRLFIADLREKTIDPLTSAAETVEEFDICDKQHYVYVVAEQTEWDKSQSEGQRPAIVATGRSLDELLFPHDSSNRTRFWAVVGGNRFEVKHAGVPVVPAGKFALSPDGRSLVTTLVVPEVPSSWETLYPPPFASDRRRILTRHMDLQSERSPVHQYVLISLKTGSVKALTDAPVSADGGSWATVIGGPSWSTDGQTVILPGTFVSSKEHAPSRPCVAVVELNTNTRTCVESLKGRTEDGFEEGYHLITGVRFAMGNSQEAMVSSRNIGDFYSRGTNTIEYRRSANGSWRVASQFEGVPEVGPSGLEVRVKEGLNDPPLLVVSNKETSRVIWNPNPQLHDFELGDASVYTWKDKKGKDWKGVLFRPSGYNPGQRYPLVIQTHGITETNFEPSGFFPTAFAARALAAAGIVVLQIQDLTCTTVALEEGQCAVSGYESAATQLVSEGVVDQENIGIIGFSRSCFYVMETLTTGTLRIKAASITDGVMEDYFQYMQTERVANEANSIIGALPFGEGLQHWLKRSPGFNLDKIKAPLLVVGEGPSSLLFMWQPYGGLRYLHKPVDLIMLNTDEHVLTNPAVRLASQGGSVDWFRFWLQDYEDPDPAKKDQYERWRGLKEMQEENDAKGEAAMEKAPLN
jgi:dipeptidyl aminopeptidase/acylaminoacyl peptidase